MKYIECPNEYLPQEWEISIFLAGGISGCWDWQSELVNKLESLNIIVYNPRRQNFDLSNKNMSLEQIRWEHKYLKISDSISFWFPHETVCPITLLEYGKWMASDKKIFLGVHEKYSRKFDLEVQTLLENEIENKISISYSLKDLSQNIIEYYKYK